MIIVLYLLEYSTIISPLGHPLFFAYPQFHRYIDGNSSTGYTYNGEQVRNKKFLSRQIGFRLLFTIFDKGQDDTNTDKTFFTIDPMSGNFVRDFRFKLCQKMQVADRLLVLKWFYFSSRLFLEHHSENNNDIVYFVILY